MTHPLATELAPIINNDVHELRRVVAEWVVREQSAQERARYRRFGAALGPLKARIAARPVPPTEEELEIAMTAMLVIAGRRFYCGGS
ncbi:hypothetical protein ACFL5O_10215 [Myxococcota bacterium]